LSSVRIKASSHTFTTEAAIKNYPTLEAALGLSAPWKVTEDTFTLEEKRLDITLDFEPGSTFACPDCGADGAKAYDTKERTWRHLNFFQHETYLHPWGHSTRGTHYSGRKDHQASLGRSP